MATHSSILTWRIARTEGPGYSPWGPEGLDITEGLTQTPLLLYQYFPSHSLIHSFGQCLYVAITLFNGY